LQFEDQPQVQVVPAFLSPCRLCLWCRGADQCLRALASVAKLACLDTRSLHTLLLTSIPRCTTISWTS
jgi:hypothetical protein